MLHSIQILQDMKKHAFRPTLFPLLLLLMGTSVLGQNPAQGIDYPAFLEKLAAENLSFAAEKYNISIAEAGVLAARALPDPELSFTLYDNQEQRLGMGYGFETELSWTLELGGKRAARKQVAAAQLTLVQLETRDFFRTLKKEATTAWLTVLKNKKEYKDLQETAEFLNELASVKEKAALRTAQDELEVLLQNNRREHEQLLQEMMILLHALRLKTFTSHSVIWKRKRSGFRNIQRRWKAVLRQTARKQNLPRGSAN